MYVCVRERECVCELCTVQREGGMGGGGREELVCDSNGDTRPTLTHEKQNKHKKL